MNLNGLYGLQSGMDQQGYDDEELMVLDNPQELQNLELKKVKVQNQELQMREIRFM